MMRPGIDYCPGARGNQRRANSGGPMSRTRREVICSTLLGNDERPIRCPRIVRLGIGFPNGDPVERSEVCNAGLRSTARRLGDLTSRAVARRPPAHVGDGTVDISYDARDVPARADAGVVHGAALRPVRPVL
jgi:hypothetical protein